MVKLFSETRSLERKYGSAASKKRSEVIAHADVIMENALETSIPQLHQQLNLSARTTYTGIETFCISYHGGQCSKTPH